MCCAGVVSTAAAGASPTAERRALLFFVSQASLVLLSAQGLGLAPFLAWAQQCPRIPIAFVPVAMRMSRLRWQQRQSFCLLASQKNHRRDQVPNIPGDDVRRKKVDLLQRVRLSTRARLELAQVSEFSPAVRGLHLHFENPRTRFDADIVSRRIAPRPRYLEPMLDGRSHKAQLHPLPALLERSEILASMHSPTPLSSP